MNYNMKKTLKIYIFGALLLGSNQLFAGNPDRTGTSGAAQLQINPWARSSGWGGANVAGVQGIEASYLNIAGLAFTKKTELLFNHTNLFQGTGQSFNTLGFSQAVGKKSNGGVMGVYINNYSSGDIERTTYSQPEGGLGTFSYQTLDLGIAYAKSFSKSIFGGMNCKIVSMGMSDSRASGFSLDAGIQYRTSSNKKTERIKGQDVKFGISIKNIGPDLSYRGDGLSLRGTSDDKTYSQTLEQRSAGFNLPSMVNIGASYDFRLDGKSAETYYHRLTLAANFTSNSFNYDQTSVGLEYAYKSFLMVRAGYQYEKNIGTTLSTSAFNGYSSGITLELPFSKNKSTFAMDYSYRLTQVWGGVHTLGVRINLGASVTDED